VTTGNPAALRVAVVGPSHPAKGGVAAHTTTLAHELADAGHDVVLVSWASMFPKVLYPGEQTVPGGEPDVEPYPRTVPVLHWSRPESWVRTGWRLRDVDVIVVVHVIPQVVPAHLAMLRAAGAGRPGGPRAVAVVHNVLPHESRPGDKAFMRLLFGAVEGVVVHTEDEAKAAIELGAARVAVTPLPPHLPGGPPEARMPHDGPTRLLALGLVRPYKGIDLLLRALARVPGPTLTVAGEMWGDASTELHALAADPRLAGRVRLLEGYVPGDRIASVLASHDVFCLAYRHATASQNVLLAHEHGLPVLATRVGSFPGQVRDDVDGLLVPPSNEDALVAALTRLADPAYAAQLADGVRPPDLHGPWATYVGTIEALGAAPAAVDIDVDPYPGSAGGASGAGPEPTDRGSGPSRRGPRARLAGGLGGARAAVGAVAGRASRGLAGPAGSGGRGRHVEVHRADFPVWVRPSDLLSTEDEAQETTRLARDLGLPRARDPIAAWAALGALAAVVRLRTREGADAEVIDCSGNDSPFGAWLRATGHTPVEWTLPAADAPLDSVELDSGSCDVLTMLHPTDCDSDDIDQLLTQATWVLRRGGLLCFTLAAGSAAVPGAVAPADVRSVLARADARGLVLAGDLDGDITERLRGASLRGESLDAAYGIVRLTFRRR